VNEFAGWNVIVLIVLIVLIVTIKTISFDRFMIVLIAPRSWS
jgi:hypothetical protein